MQPDAVITTPHCYALVEAKRIRTSSFQPEQLAREYLLTMREAEKADADAPLLLLILGKEPPVHVQGSGRLAPEDSIRQHLASVRERSEPDDSKLDALVERIPEVVAWVTWSEVKLAVERATAAFSGTDSVSACVRRLASAVTQAIDWHGSQLP